jgi:hypothetical protein
VALLPDAEDMQARVAARRLAYEEFESPTETLLECAAKRPRFPC